MFKKSIFLLVAVFVLSGGARWEVFAAVKKHPRVILVMTDDQGYGDLHCHGNQQIKTPFLDKLYRESIRLTNYHVDPTCSPTRSALMTGRYSSRTGVWHTIMGRSLMAPDETTIAEVFAAAGYRTAIFGKWHLGDNYPCRPQDQGFQTAVVCGGGGVTKAHDYWGNDYFDDTYYFNGVPTAFTGYCTDVWFDLAIRFIRANKDKPFFLYLPTNAAHAPYFVSKRYSEPYHRQGIPSPRAEFYGMITNIDENMARLQRCLEELGIADEVILIFTTDNGTSAGSFRGGFNAGMRGHKGSEYDGGHRVPFFIRWPAGGIGGGKDVPQLTAHIDVLPTLAELCNVPLPKGLDLDGKSLVPLLKGTGQWTPRTLVVHSQRVEFPEKWRKCAVMTDRWRLVNGKELYDMKKDPGQRTNVAPENPEVVKRLRTAYEHWWKHISDRFDDYVRIVLGAPEENPTTLICHDWHTNNGKVPWNQGAIRRDLRANGFWAVRVARDGRYRFTLRVRPKGVPHELDPGTARLKIGEVELSKNISKGMREVVFETDLKAGDDKLQTWLVSTDGKSRGAYFVEVERLEKR